MRSQGEYGRSAGSASTARRRASHTDVPANSTNSSRNDSTTGTSPQNASATARSRRSVQHHAMVEPPSPQSARCVARTVTTVGPAPCSSTLMGNCQHTDGFQSSGLSPASTAARCRAHPTPPAKPGRLRKMHAPSTRPVADNDASRNTSNSPTRSWNCHRWGGMAAALAEIVIASVSSAIIAPTLQQPCCRSADGVSRIPSQPRPHVQVQFDETNARSNRHRTPASSGSSISIHWLTCPTIGAPHGTLAGWTRTTTS